MKPWLYLVVLGMGVMGWVAHPVHAAEEPQQIDVYHSGKEGYHTFRIPALLMTQKGTLLAFCEGRKTSRADHGDIDLVLKRSSDGGQTWTPLQLVYEEGDTAKITIGNPCPVQDRETGVIWLPFTRDNDDVFVTHSRDDGQTWSEPVKITSAVKKSDWSWYATGPGVGIQMRTGPHAGRLIIPCDHRVGDKGRGTTYSHVIYSDDHGKTWQLGGTVAPHTNECQLAELPDGTLIINMRNYWGRDGKEAAKDKMRAIAFSKDGGATWSDLHFDKTLIEPICQASLHRYDSPAAKDQGWLLFSNPASTTTRHRLTVRLSKDGGKTWPTSWLLNKGPSAYSCLGQLPDGTVLCLYERGDDSPYEKITLARFPLKP